MTSPLVSVIVPCFNGGAYIDDAIDSILEQTYKSFEIVVIDDGSTEEFTRQKLQNFLRPNTTIVHTINQGPAEARNVGIRKTRGEYILPLDSDDKLSRNYLAESVRVLERNPAAGIVYGNAMYFGDRAGEYRLPKYSLNTILLKNVIFNSAMYRRSDWERIGGYNKAMVQVAEDYDFWLSLLKLNIDVVKIPAMTYYYRIRKDSRTSELKRKNRKYSAVMLQLYNNHRDLFSDDKRVHISVRVINRLRFSKLATQMSRSSAFIIMRHVAAMSTRLLLKLRALL